MTDYYIVRTPDRQTATRLYNILLDIGQDLENTILKDWVVRGFRFDEMSGIAFTSHDNGYMCYISEEQIRTTSMSIITVEDFINIVKPNIGRITI